MADTEQYLAGAGFDVGLLFSIIGTPFYESQGWTPIPLPTFSFESDGLERAASAEGSVRALDVARDLDAVAGIYAHCTKGMTGPEVRPAGYWTTGPSRFRGVFPGWGAVRDGKVVAYVNIEGGEDRTWIKEACAAPGDEGAYDDLASLVVGETARSGAREIAGSLPRGHLLIDRLANALGGRPALGTHDEMMVKLANWGSLTRKLAGESSPDPPDPERPFWEAVFGLRPVPAEAAHGPWLAVLPPCDGPFYWWTDIF
jgi:hypothetical protein